MFAVKFILTLIIIQLNIVYGHYGHQYKTHHDHLKTLYQWKYIDFTYESNLEREAALLNRSFIPENVLPLGLEIWGDRIFVSLPSWKPGRPVTLATLPRYSNTQSPLLKPYPDWRFQESYKCDGLTSVFRMSVDPCGRLWVLDSGVVEAADNATRVCPPSIFIFNLYTDKLIKKIDIPSTYVLENSLFSNIIVDTRYSNCFDTHAYIADTWSFALLVFREHDSKFWRFSHHLFYPDPEASSYNLHGVKFQWPDGIFGLSLTPISYYDRVLLFHPLSSYREIAVKTSVLRNPDCTNSSVDEFVLLGESKGLNTQSSASVVDRYGVMHFGLVSLDSIGCWDTNKPLLRKNLHIEVEDHENLIWPNDIKVDNEYDQNLWVISNKLPFYQVTGLSLNEYNYRIMYASVTDLIAGTICDPNMFFDSVYSNEVDDSCILWNQRYYCPQP